MKHLKLQHCLSTQEEIKKLDLSENILVSTIQQSKGFGRRKTPWVHFSESLAFSFSCQSHETISLTPLEVSVLVSEYFYEFYSQSIMLKWPNDLISSDNKKLGGILCELINARVVVGIGINIGETLNNLISDQRIVTGLALPDNLPKNHHHHLPYDFYEYFQAHRISDSGILVERWTSLCGHLNRPCRIIDGENISEGIFVGIGRDGRAILHQENKILECLNGSLIIDP